MLVSSLITVLGLAFVVGILYHYFQGQLMGELKKEAVYISRGVESAGTDYLKKLNDEDSRITYVDESGKVIYDNEAAWIITDTARRSVKQRSTEKVQMKECHQPFPKKPCIMQYALKMEMC